jgi:hypothetical protein
MAAHINMTHTVPGNTGRGRPSNNPSTPRGSVRRDTNGPAPEHRSSSHCGSSGSTWTHQYGPPKHTVPGLRHLWTRTGRLPMAPAHSRMHGICIEDPDGRKGRPPPAIAAHNTPKPAKPHVTE